MRLTPEVELLVRQPLGILIQGEIPQPYEILAVSHGDAPIVAVGDVVTENLERVGILPTLSILDGKTKRADISGAEDKRRDADLVIANPKGTITRELWEAIAKCDFQNRKIFIDGEEDLATLPAILYAPMGSIVVYGQPDEGIVVVHVTDEKKNEIKSIIEKMEGEKWI
jgi:uncharacterized protein (UPF0218 family)